MHVQEDVRCSADAGVGADLRFIGDDRVECSTSAADDVVCAPEESVLLTCAGGGSPIGPSTSL